MSNSQLVWRKLRKDRPAIIGCLGLLALLLSALAAPWLAPYDPLAQNYDAILAPPSATYLFGADDLGRDLLSRVIWGGRESLKVGLLGVAIALVSGTVVGLISGYAGGWLDNLIQRCNEILLAFPVILLLLSIVTVLGTGLTTIMIALGIAVMPTYARLVRSVVLEAKSYDYVDAAHALGAPHRRIMLRHILPNILAPIIVYGTLDLGYAILATAGLSYIGLGAQPPSPEWGAMLNAGRNFIYDAWWMSLFPGVPLFLSVLFVNLLGDGLRDALDPKLRR